MIQTKTNCCTKKILLAVLIALFIQFSACTNQPPGTPTETTMPGLLTPYITITPENSTSNRAATTETKSTPTPLPSPTPTPVLYSIIEGDTLTAIAFRHGIKLNDLLAANPGIDPNFLTIGMTITIPTLESASSANLNPTPIPVEIQQPICYPTAEQGLWCLAPVLNNQPYPVENISAQIRLLSADLAEPRQQTALSPINVIPPQTQIPLSAFFAPPIPEKYAVFMDLATVLPVPENDDRYLKVDLQIQETVISEDSQSATVFGTMTNLDETRSVGKINLAAIARDQNDAPIGVRKWIIEEVVAPGESYHFEITVFSLGPQVVDVILMGEATP